MAEEKEKKKKPERATSLTDLRKSLNKTFGDGTVMVGDNAIVNVDVFPSGVASIDLALGCKGIPQGRVMELFGLESSGKTTTALHFIAACQRHRFTNSNCYGPKNRSGVAAFIDAEHAYDPIWARKCGVKTDDVLFSQPNGGEEALEIARHMAESGLVDLIVIDSVASLVPMKEAEGEIGDANMGAQGRMMSQGLRILTPITAKTKTTILFINQIRQKLGIQYGNPDTTPGGLALKFYASIRAEIRKGAKIEGGKDSVLGFTPTLKFIKNKCAAPFTKAEYDICVGHSERPVYGIDTVMSLFQIGLANGLITKKGSFYNFGGTNIGNGEDNAVATLRKDTVLAEALKGQIYSSVTPTVAAPSGEAEASEDDDAILDHD